MIFTRTLSESTVATERSVRLMTEMPPSEFKTANSESKTIYILTQIWFGERNE